MKKQGLSRIFLLRNRHAHVLLVVRIHVAYLSTFVFTYVFRQVDLLELRPVRDTTGTILYSKVVCSPLVLFQREYRVERGAWFKSAKGK